MTLNPAIQFNQYLVRIYNTHRRTHTQKHRCHCRTVLKFYRCQNFHFFAISKLSIHQLKQFESDVISILLCWRAGERADGRSSMPMCAACVYVCACVCICLCYHWMLKCTEWLLNSTSTLILYQTPLVFQQQQKLYRFSPIYV